MDALLEDFVRNGEHEVVVVTTGRNKSSIFLQDGNIKYYMLPGGLPHEYNHTKEKNKKAWLDLISAEKPDIIQVWGTEYKHGLAAIKAAPNTPSVIYMQGVLEAVARYYEGGIEHSEWKKMFSIRDIVKNETMRTKKQRYYKNAVYESEMLNLAGNIISENIWCDVHCKAIAPKVKTHYCPLSINEVFSDYKWTVEKMEPYTVMVNAAWYPLKGLHMVLRAIDLVKRKYPDVKVYIPGLSIVKNNSLKDRLKKTGYTKYIEKLITLFNLNDNLVFTDRLTAVEMAEKMATVNAFIMGSALENHSSTLKEAMQVGTPCVASIVGGIPEYAIHGENALLYRFEEYELMAEYIINIFENRELANKLSDNARRSMLNLHNSDQIYNTIVSIYSEVVKNWQNKD